MNPRPDHRALSTRARVATIAIVASFGLAAPSIASAATDRWVDAETGSDASGNACTSAANPCKTIMQASNSSQMAGNAGTIHVDQGTYSENVIVAQSNHLLADDFVPGDSGPTAISGTSVAVFAQATASVSGFDITSTTSGAVALVMNDASLTGNEILAKGQGSTAVEVFASNGHPEVTDNTVLADSGDEARGVRVNNGVVAATIADNRIGSPAHGFEQGIDVDQNGAAEIVGNEIAGMSQIFGSSARGINVSDPAGLTITRNRIGDGTPSEEVDGIYIDGLDADKTIALSHNEVVSVNGIGLVVGDTAGVITSEGDVIARTSDRAIYAGNVADLRLTGATVVDGDYIDANNAHLTIDSSIFDEPIDASSGTTCAITHSRGPAIVEGGDGCGHFQTTLDPSFVDRFGATPDLHLSPDSPLIDAGNPESPAAGAVDMDGDPRALEGDGECPIDAERDMGADEVVVSLPDCRPAPPPPPPAADKEAPQTSVAGKRRQRGQRARFMLRSSEEGSKFECRIDRGEFAACRPDYRSPRLALGRHRIVVRAIDSAGNVDSSPSVKRFRLKPRPR